MSGKIIIRLLSNEIEQVEYLSLDKDSQQETSFKRLSLSEIKAVDPLKQVILLVPAQDILLTTAQLPKTSYNKHIKALPAALEEQLIDDIDLLHFAAGKMQADGSLPVAVVSHQRMNEWLNVLKEQANQIYFQLQSIVPDVLMLPLQENSWTVYLENQLALIKINATTGFAVDYDNLLEVLLAKIHEAENDKPQYITVIADQAEVANLKQVLEVLPIDKHIELKTNDSLPIGVLNENELINLLQRPYARKAKPLASLKSWYITGFLILVWLAILLVANTSKFIYLSYKNNQLQQQITSIYREVFPHSVAIVDPKARFTQELQLLTNAQTRSTFLKFLTSAATAIQAVPGISLQALEFHNNQLTLTLQTNDIANFDKLNQQLNARKITSKQTDTSRNGIQFQTQLIISEAK